MHQDIHGRVLDSRMAAGRGQEEEAESGIMPGKEGHKLAGEDEVAEDGEHLCHTVALNCPHSVVTPGCKQTTVLV